MFENNDFNNTTRVGGIPFPSGSGNLSGPQGGMVGSSQEFMNNQPTGGYQTPFLQDPIVGGFTTQESNVRNKNWHIGNVLTRLFGEGYSFNAVKVPSDEVFPDKVRHFDRTGFSYMYTQRGTYQSVGPDGFVVNVEVTYSVCHACRKVYYRVENVF